MCFSGKPGCRRACLANFRQAVTWSRPHRSFLDLNQFISCFAVVRCSGMSAERVVAIGWPPVIREDDVVFPACERHTGHAPDSLTALLSCEHRHLLRCLERFEAALDAGQPTMAPEWVVFAGLLTGHHRREEQLAYPEIERALTDGERRALLAMLHALGLDAVIHSGTKYLNGHSDLNAGVVVASSAIVESLVCVPSRTSHLKLSPAERERAGISDGLIRVSVGIEDIEDLLEDLTQTLEVVDCC